jgi:BCL2-associated athanogene 2
MEWQGGADAGSGTNLPQIVEPKEGSRQKSPKSKLVTLLDEVEMHVERLRRDALKLEEEKDRLLSTLDSVRDSEIMIDLRDSKYTSLWEFRNSSQVQFLYTLQMS